MRFWWWVILAVLLVLILGGGYVAALAVKETIVTRIARAIAGAEGFYVAGSRPARNHNPGNLTRDITGTGIGRDAGPVTYIVYKSDADGWAALEKQVRLMFSGSAIYQPQMSILEVARKYTGTEQIDWARNVARSLGVSTSATLNDVARILDAGGFSA